MNKTLSQPSARVHSCCCLSGVLSAMSVGAGNFRVALRSDLALPRSTRIPTGEPIVHYSHTYIHYSFVHLIYCNLAGRYATQLSCGSQLGATVSRQLGFGCHTSTNRASGPNNSPRHILTRKPRHTTVTYGLNSAPLRDISFQNLSDLDFDLSMSLRSNVIAPMDSQYVLSY